MYADGTAPAMLLRNSFIPANVKREKRGQCKTGDNGQYLTQLDGAGQGGLQPAERSDLGAQANVKREKKRLM